MARQDIIVVGASAGGIEVLRSLVGELPPDLPASVIPVGGIVLRRVRCRFDRERSDGRWGAGLWQVKHNGGIAIVQNPKEARFPDMPCSALERVAVHYIVQTSEMGGLLTNLSNGRVPAGPAKDDLKAAGLAECKRRRL